MNQELLTRMILLKSHPKWFLQYGVFTKDGNDLKNPCKRFPFELGYHREICDAWYQNPLMIIEKSRQMQISWHMLATHLWLALTGPDREIYVRRQTMDDAQKLLDDMRYIYDHIPESVWPKYLLPTLEAKEGFLRFPQLNTFVYAVSSGRDKMRGRTPTAVFLDEFAFQDDAEMVYQTLKPSIQGGGKVTIVSTPKPLFGDEDPIFRRLFEDRS